MTPPVLVTGATGFLGRALVRRLVRAGYAVHALARAGSDRTPLADLDLRWHLGELGDPPSLEAAAAQLGAGGWLVHGAALISYRTRDRARQRAVNVEGTRALLAAARRARLARVVHVSSIAAVGHAIGDEALDERAPWNAAGLSDYADTKREAERVALALADALDLRVVCPGAIFGPDPRANTSRFLDRLARGRLGPVVAPGGLSVLGVEDAAEGVQLALERGQRGRRYLLVESHHRLVDLCRRAAVELGTLGRRAPVPRAAPRWAWRGLVAAARLVDRVRPLEHATPQALAMLGARWRASGARARAELGWRPRPFDAVLRDTLRALVGPPADDQ